MFQYVALSARPGSGWMSVPTDHVSAVCGPRLRLPPAMTIVERPPAAGSVSPGASHGEKGKRTARVSDAPFSVSARLGASNAVPQFPRKLIQLNGLYVAPNFGLNVPPKSE